MSYQGPIPAARLPLVAVLRKADQVMAELVARAATEGTQTACAAGCAACCTYVVSCTQEEAELVADLVQQMPTPLQEEVLARLWSWHNHWEREAEARGGRSLGEDLARTALAWQRRRIACPFLHLETHRCLVYPVRPMPCRTYHACYPPADLPPQPCGCAVLTPGDGCFTTAADVAHGHNAEVWQIRGDLQIKTTEAIFALLASQGVTRSAVGILPQLVLRAGRRAYGWKRPRRPGGLPMLTQSRPEESPPC